MAMTEPAQVEDSIRVDVLTKASPQRAFEVWTAEIGSWWNPKHHLLPGPLAAMGVDPEVGGRLWETNTAGETCVWGRVLRWEPGEVFAFAWLIGPDWGVPHPDAPASRVTVTFAAEGDRTRVTLIHDRISAHGPGWESVYRGVGSAGGWPGDLASFAATADRAVPSIPTGS
jgi:uncharacterized protein YndB with AHSA1/START domain